MESTCYFPSASTNNLAVLHTCCGGDKVHGFYCCPTAVGEHKYQCKIGHLGACQCIGSECHKRGHGGHGHHFSYWQSLAGVLLLACFCLLPGCARAGRRRQFQVINGPGPACSAAGYGGGSSSGGFGTGAAIGLLGGMLVGEQMGRWEDRGFGGGYDGGGGGGDGGDIAADFGGGDGDF